MYGFLCDYVFISLCKEAGTNYSKMIKNYICIIYNLYWMCNLIIQYVGRILDLQKSCKDNTNSLLMLLIQFPSFCPGPNLGSHTGFSHSLVLWFLHYGLRHVAESYCGGEVGK